MLKLSQVLLRLANVTDDPDEQLEFYEQSLRIDPQNTEARLASNEIWKERGERAMSVRHLSEAASAYRRSGHHDLEQRVRDEIRAQRIAKQIAKSEEYERDGKFAEALGVFDRIECDEDGRFQTKDLKNWDLDIRRLQNIIHTKKMRND
jgi:tetratricopeptide (TPR) repeat protein